MPSTQASRPLPRSLYAQTARPGVPAPPVDGDKHVSVAVVGGGFTGLSAALHLAQAGVDVAVLEANEPGWGASGRNGGQVNPGLKYEPDEIERDFGPELGARMVAFSGNAPNTVFDLVRQHQITCEGRQSGTLRAAYTAKHAAPLRPAAEQWQRRGAPVELLEQDAVRTATGSDRYLCAMLDRRGGSVNPLGYARGLAEAAANAGATIHGSSPAQRIQRHGTKWSVQTPGGFVSADTLILATNAYTDALWPGLRRSIVPVFSGIIASEPLSDELAARIMPERSVLYENGAITVYYRLDASNRLLMGGRSPMRDLDDPAQFAWMVRYTTKLWPDLADVKWTHCWNGQLAVTTDHYPHFHEPAEGVLVSLGYNGRGVAMATAMGGELARRALGTPVPELNMPVTSIKEIPFHALWRNAARGRIVYGRIRDALGL